MGIREEEPGVGRLLNFLLADRADGAGPGRLGEKALWHVPEVIEEGLSNAAGMVLVQF